MAPASVISIKPPAEARYTAVVTAVALVIACAIAISVAGHPGPALSWFLPLVCGATVLVNLVTCYLLFGQFVVSGAAASAILGAGYLFSATMAGFFLATFPSAGGGIGWADATPQAPSWIWVAWHAGFSLIAIAYAAADRHKPKTRPKAWLFGPAMLNVLIALAASLALGSALTLYSDRLPPLIVGRDYGGAATNAIGLATLAINIGAFGFVLARLRGRTLLQLWLTVSMLGFALATTLTALAQHRYSLGWHLAPVISLAASATVLLALIHEMTVLYAKLVTMQATLRAMVDIDGLTGLANRRRFNTLLKQHWLNAKREAAPLSIVMADIDHFKTYNDVLGHPAGDECLRRVAAAITGAIQRPLDLAARYGGEEFAIILPNTDAAGARKVAERLHRAVHDLRLPQPAEPGAWVHVSVGAATATAPFGSSESELVARADALLYRAKREGRDRVVCEEPATRPRKLALTA